MFHAVCCLIHAQNLRGGGGGGGGGAGGPESPEKSQSFKVS